MAKLSRRQQEIYNFILSFTNEHGYPPLSGKLAPR